MGLADDANVGVTATVLTALTIACLFQIKGYLENMRYKAAQKWAIPILTLSFCLGWANWVILYKPSSYELVGYILLIYKSLIFVCFLNYLERLIGWDNKEGTNFYNSEKLIPFIASIGHLKGCYSCCKLGIMDTEERAKKYLRRVRIALLQFPVMMLIIFALAIILSILDKKTAKVTIVLDMIKLISSIYALFNLMTFTLSIGKQPELHGLGIYSKLVWIKICILFTEMQPNLLLLLTGAGLVYNSDDMNDNEVSGYTNAMLIFYEMIILGFLQFHTFPVSDFFVTPRERMEKFERKTFNENSSQYEKMI